YEGTENGEEAYENTENGEEAYEGTENGEETYEGTQNRDLDKRSSNVEKVNAVNPPGTPSEGNMDGDAVNIPGATDTSPRTNDYQSNDLSLNNEIHSADGEFRGSYEDYNNCNRVLPYKTYYFNDMSSRHPFSNTKPYRAQHSEVPRNDDDDVKDKDKAWRLFHSRSLNSRRYTNGPFVSSRSTKNEVYCWDLGAITSEMSPVKDQTEQKAEKDTEVDKRSSTREVVPEQKCIKQEEPSKRTPTYEVVFESIQFDTADKTQNSTTSPELSLSDLDVTSLYEALGCDEANGAADGMGSQPPSKAEKRSLSPSLETKWFIEFTDGILYQENEQIQRLSSVRNECDMDGKNATTHLHKHSGPETDEKSRELGAVPKEIKTSTDDPILLEDRIHSLVAVTDNAGSKVTLKEAEKKVTVKDSDGKMVDFEADEVLRASKVTAENSILLKELLQQVEASHNVALILASTKNAQDTSLGVAQTFMKAIMAKLAKDEGAKGLKYHAHMTAVAMPSPDSARDLFASSSAQAKPVRFGSNPLYGVCLLNLEEKSVKSEKDAEKLLQGALKKSSDTKETVVLHMVLKRIKKSSGGKGDVYLSSVLLVFVRENADYLAGIFNKDEKVVPVPLFKDVVGGSCRSLVVTALSGSDAATEAKILKNAEKLRGVKTNAPRSGNLTRFMEYASEKVAHLESKENRTSRDQRTLNMMRSMLVDIDRINSDLKWKQLVYPVRSLHELDDWASVSEDGDKGLLGKRDVSESSLGSFEERNINRVAVVENTGVDVTSSTLTLRNGKVYRMEECIYCKGSANDGVHSAILSRLTELFSAGNNLAILGANMSSGAATQDPLIWKSLKDILSSVVENSIPNIINMLTLRMCLVKGHNVIGDLLGSGDEMPLSLLVSPLFGPVVDGIEVKELKDSTEVDNIITNALQRASELMQDGAAVVAIAVLKQVLDNDVRLASLFVASAQNLDAYYYKTGKYSKHPLALFDSSFNSPCITTAVLTYDYANSEEEIVETSLNRMESLAVIKRPSIRPGSVNAFIKNARSALSNQYNVGFNGSEQLELVLADHERMLMNPLKEKPMVYHPEQFKYPRMNVTTVAILRKKVEPLSSDDFPNVLSSDSEASSGKVEDIDSNVDEFLTLSNGVTAIRSEQLQIVESVFEGGGNAAVLLAGMQGSNVPSHVIRHIAHNVLVDTLSINNLRMSMVALKSDGTAKDLLREGGTYEEYTINVFPHVGPLLNGANLVVPPPDAASLEKHLGNAYLECIAEKALLVVVFLKYSTHETDKCRSLRSSLLLTLAGEDLEPYTTALSREPHGLGIFQYALAGPCRTVAIFGLTKIDGEVASEFMKVLCRLRYVLNPVMVEENLKNCEETPNLVGF
ncbi:uncharacterized protein TM35_000232240, partial [Trypanosoma theileri]